MKLFKNAYRGLHGKPELRIYFEHDDMSLFVWINDQNELKAFQADLHNDLCVHFRRPDHVTFGQITNEPISGGISGTLSDNEIAVLRNLLNVFFSPDFPVLFSMIKGCVNGHPPASFSIPGTEMNRLKKSVSITSYPIQPQAE